MTATIIKIYKIDGRQFTGGSHASFTASQTDYIQAQLRLAGAVEILHDLDGIERTPEKRADDLLTAILLRGQKAKILSACLTEEGKTWSPAEADRNAARFEAIVDVSEQTEMRRLIETFVIGLVAVGEISQESSADIPPTQNALLTVN